MAIEIAQAVVQIVPSMKGVGSAIQKAFGDASDSAGRSAGEQAGGGFSTGFAGKLGVVSGLVQSVAGKAIDAFMGLSCEIMDASDSAQKFGSTLSFAGVSTQQIEKLTKSTQEYADKTVFGLSDIRNTTAQLAANGVPNYDKLAEAAGNLTAVAGGGANEFRSVAMALTQTAGAGKLTTENWNQLADAIPGASGKLQQAMKDAGAYTGDFRDAMANGEITAQEFNDALMKLGLSDVAVEAATSAATMEGAFGNLEAAAVKLGSSMLDSVKPAVTGIINTLADGITAAVPVVQNGINKIGQIIQGLGTLIIKGDFTSALRQAFNVEEDSPLVNSLLTMRDAIIRVTDNIKTILINFGAAAGSALTGALQTLGLASQGAISPLTALQNALQTIGQTSLTALADGITMLANTLNWFVEHGQLTATAIIAIGTAFAAVKGYTALNNGLIALTGTMNGVAGAAQGLSNALVIAPELNSVTGALKAYAGNLTIVANAQKALKAGQGMFTALGGAARGLGTALSGTLGPWGLVAVAVAALAAGLAVWFTQTESGKAAWQSLMDFLAPLWQQVQAAWSAALPVLQQLMQSLGDTLSNVVQAIGPALQQLGPMLSQVFGGLMQTITPFLQQMGPAIDALLAPIKANLPALQQAFGQLSTALGQSLQAIMPVVQQLAGTFLQMLPTFAQFGATLVQLGATLATALIPVIGQILALVGQLMPVFGQIVATVASALVPVITTIVQLIATVMPVIMQLVTTLVSALAPVIQAIATALVAVVPVIAMIVTTLVGMLVPVITAIVNVITALLPVVTSVINGILSVVQPVLTAITGIIQGVTTVLQGVITFLQGVFSGNWQQAWQGIQQVFQGVWQALSAFFEGVWNALQAALKAGLDIIKSVWDSVWNAVKSVAETIWNGIKSAITAAVQNVQQAIDSTLNAIKGVWDSIWNAVSSTVSNIWNQVTSTVSNGVNNVLNFVQSIPSKIMGFFSNAGSMLVNAGSQIIQGLWNGISGAIGGLYNNIKNALGGLVDQAKSALGIHSPSRVFRDQVGRMIGAGMAEGLTDMAPAVQSAADGLIPDLPPIGTDITPPGYTRHMATPAVPMPAAQTDGTRQEDMEAAFTRALSKLPLVVTYTNERQAAIALAPAMNRRMGELQEMETLL